MTKADAVTLATRSMFVDNSVRGCNNFFFVELNEVIQAAHPSIKIRRAIARRGKKKIVLILSNVSCSSIRNLEGKISSLPHPNFSFRFQGVKMRKDPPEKQMATDDKSNPSRHQLLMKLEENLGFRWKDLRNFDSFVQLLHQPRDPSCLATVRILFGFLMILDVLNERGLLTLDQRWGDPWECKFPLFSFIRPLPLQWMYLIYLVMLLGAFGIMLGWRYRMSCVCFIIPYWYIFLADKSRWNNHSYLFGLLTVQLAVSGANRCWSVDGHFNPEVRHSHVPLWNYFLLRGQVFLVYFIAGLKKIDFDWLGGYSMGNLGTHWVFDGFRLFLTDHQISFFVVHVGGFLLDLTIGFFMALKFSRAYAFIFCAAFNLMNSRMFTIGMFPYVMIAVMPIFCNADLPKRILALSPQRIQKILLYPDEAKRNPGCSYEDVGAKVYEKKAVKSNARRQTKFSQKATSVLLCIYFLTQLFLPYSHWLTKGYNTWTSGPYGYSWDMMVHHWRYMHASVTAVEKSTGKQLFLNPEVWTSNWRWTHHADMVKQFSHCVEDRLATRHNITDIEIYIDVWLSLNRRFTQRIYDPTVNLLEAKWSPFQEVPWVLPLLTGLSGWRQKLQEVEDTLYNKSQTADVVFITDFPGFGLLNYIDQNIGNTTLQVLRGHVALEYSPDDIVNLEEGQKIEVLSGHFHKVSPLHHKPACYMYIYNKVIKEGNESGIDMKTKALHFSNPSSRCEMKQTGKEIGTQTNDKIQTRSLTLWDDFEMKFKIWYNSLRLIGRSLRSIFTGEPMSIKRKKRASFC